MAFTNTRRADDAQSSSSNDSWKAKGFLNFYVQRADGSKAKVGAIPLKEARKFDKALIERLQQEDGVEAFLKVLKVDFQLADSGVPADAGF